MTASLPPSGLTRTAREARSTNPASTLGNLQHSYLLFKLSILTWNVFVFVSFCRKIVGNSHRRTKTVAFSSSSNNLVSQGQSQQDSSSFPDTTSSTTFTGDHEDGCNGNGSSGNGLMHMLVKLPEGGLSDVSTQLLCTPVGESTASLAAAMNASAQRQAHTGTMHHIVETETITVDKE